MLVIKSEYIFPKTKVYSPRFDALYVHIRFTQCKRVDIILLQIRKRVVDESVRRLIRSYCVDHV